MMKPKLFSFFILLSFMWVQLVFSKEGHILNDIYTEVVVDNPNGGVNKYLTFSKIDVFSKGLITEAIIGINKDKNSIDNKINPEDFLENTIFKEVMHKVIEEETPFLSAFQKEVEKQKNGWIHVIDRRGKKDKKDSDNIIGSFKIENNKIIEYRKNKNHRLLTEQGFFILDAHIEKKLINKIESYYKK